MSASAQHRSNSATENNGKWNFLEDDGVKSICLGFITMTFVIAMMINTFGFEKACAMIFVGLFNVAHAIEVYIWTEEMDREEREEMEREQRSN